MSLLDFVSSIAMMLLVSNPKNVGCIKRFRLFNQTLSYWYVYGIYEVCGAPSYDDDNFVRYVPGILES